MGLFVTPSDEYEQMWNELKNHYKQAIVSDIHTPQFKMFAIAVVSKMKELEHEEEE